jgi:hypothetical protein
MARTGDIALACVLIILAEPAQADTAFEFLCAIPGEPLTTLGWYPPGPTYIITIGDQQYTPEALGKTLTISVQGVRYIYETSRLSGNPQVPGAVVLTREGRSTTGACILK